MQQRNGREMKQKEKKKKKKEKKMYFQVSETPSSN